MYGIAFSLEESYLLRGKGSLFLRPVPCQAKHALGMGHKKGWQIGTTSTGQLQRPLVMEPAAEL